VRARVFEKITVRLHVWEANSWAVMGAAMNMYVDLQEFTPSKPKSAHFLARLLNLLRDVRSAPKGDQGGWEAGARGL